MWRFKAVIAVRRAQSEGRRVPSAALVPCGTVWSWADAQLRLEAFTEGGKPFLLEMSGI